MGLRWDHQSTGGWNNIQFHAAKEDGRRGALLHTWPGTEHAAARGPLQWGSAGGSAGGQSLSLSRMCKFPELSHSCGGA